MRFPILSRYSPVPRESTSARSISLKTISLSLVCLPGRNVLAHAIFPGSREFFLSRDTSLQVHIVGVCLSCRFRNIQFSVNFTGEPVVGTSANRANFRSWLTKYEATRECKTEMRVLTVFVTASRHYSKSQFLNSKQEIFSSPMLKVALSMHE